MFDIISIGSATIDIFLKSSQLPLERKHIGGKIEIEELMIASGGGGSNSAAGLGRLGLSAACVARFGDDLFGKFVRQDLDKESFDKKYLIEKKGDNTDCSIILVNPDGSRTILVNRGKTRIDESVFPWEALGETKYLYIASIEGNVDLLLKVVERAKEKKVAIILNPGNRELKEKEKLLTIFPKLKALVVNREEAESFGLSGRPENGPEIVVVTNGRQGAKLFSPQKNLFVEAFVHPTLDETGAGDAFSAGFVAGLVKEFPLEKALKLGMANGASVVSQFGCKPGLLYEKDIDDWLGQKLKIEQIS